MNTNTAPALKTFDFMEGVTLRVVEVEGEPWFVAADACAVLELANPSDVIKALPEKHKARKSLGLRGQAPWLVSEAGLYRLVLRSNKPEAAEFQDWVTSVVLPAIRKDGGYVMGQEKVVTGEMSETELMARAVLVANNALLRMTQERDDLAATVARKTERLNVVEPRAHGLDPETPQELTVREFCRLKGVRLNLHQRQQMGAKARVLSDVARKDTIKRSISMSYAGGRVVYGVIGVYSVDTLERALAAVL